jgi:hypothetical protein
MKTTASERCYIKGREFKGKRSGTTGTDTDV